jgi:hypothetical protein
MKIIWRGQPHYQRPNQLLSWSILLVSVAISGVLVAYITFLTWQAGTRMFDKFLKQQRQVAIQEATNQVLGGGSGPLEAPCIEEGALITLTAPRPADDEPVCKSGDCSIGID